MVNLILVGLTNLALLIGFSYIAFALLPRFEIKHKLVRWSGVSFFVMGAALRIPVLINTVIGDGSEYSLATGHLAVIQFMMSIAVWIFIVGLEKQKRNDHHIGFVTEGMADLKQELELLQLELDKKESELNKYQKERFTRSVSELQTRVEELNSIVKNTEGRVL